MSIRPHHILAAVMALPMAVFFSIWFAVAFPMWLTFGFLCRSSWDEPVDWKLLWEFSLFPVLLLREMWKGA